MEYDSGQRYRVTNRAEQTAYDVMLPDPRGFILPIDKLPRRLARGESTAFLATRAAGYPDLGVTVTWHLAEDGSDDLWERTYSLPPKG